MLEIMIINQQMPKALFRQGGLNGREKKSETKKEGSQERQKKKVGAKAKKGPAYECRVCGMRLVVDKACGCREEHTLICCNQQMVKK
jgi:hypothetical protein